MPFRQVEVSPNALRWVGTLATSPEEFAALGVTLRTDRDDLGEFDGAMVETERGVFALEYRKAYTEGLPPAIMTLLGPENMDPTNAAMWFTSTLDLPKPVRVMLAEDYGEDPPDPPRS
jgi:hypothetical protein